jgi:alpha-mannosidase
MLGAIASSLDCLRRLTQVDVQANWRLHLGDLPTAVATQAETWQNWAIASLNDRRHVAWQKGQQVLWLGQQIQIPSDLQGYPLAGLTLRIALTWWAASAQIFVDGNLVQEGDLFDCVTRILLSPAVIPGQAIAVALRLVSPGHDEGAMVQALCVYEVPIGEVSANEILTLETCPEPGFVADELAVLQHYLSVFVPEQLPLLAAALDQLDWSLLPDRDAFDRSLTTLRQQLQPLGNWVKQRQIQLLGHAHLDLAWLWSVSDTWEAAERTFRSVLQLQQDFPELIFCHSTPALYEWVEQHRPALFAAIQAQIAAGDWEVVAGLWVEPDLNLVSGESIARQVLYGQRYVQEKFGAVSKIAWLPDSFGFCWQLPQILRQGGVEYFVTQKLRWNDTTKFPHELFWWRSPDGSQVLSLNSAPIGEGINPLKMTHHACTWETKTGIPAALWLPGVGDHGGGPTRDMLETARRWQRSPFFPTLKFTTALQYLRDLHPTEQSESETPSTSVLPSPPSLPIWNDELYLEFHRGCYTTHAEQKRLNRRCEGLLYQAELFASIATLTTGATYPQAELETLWKQVLFNQFHDILPGSAIPEVFADANQTWAAAEQGTRQILTAALTAIAVDLALPTAPAPGSQPIAVFNPLNWRRSEVIAVMLPVSEPEQQWQIFNLDGSLLRSQLQVNDVGGRQLLFQAEVPSVGYCVFWLSPLSAQPQLTQPQLTQSETAESLAAELLAAPPWALENEKLRVVVNPITGDLSSIFDKTQQWEVLSAPGNQLQAFQDRGQYWDAWNIDPAYAQHPLPPAQLLSIAWIDRGLIQQRLRVIRHLGQSRFCQDYVLEARSPILKIVTQVDWQERHVLVKAAFPLNLQADFATYEIPYGAIDRPTQPATPQSAAKWEVPALQWADLSETEHGVSLINDCKYGYDSQPSQLRLTLLRGSEWPNPNADRGQHEFTYALYPHNGSWQVAATVRRGYELNQPLQVVTYAEIGPAATPSLAATGEFLNLNAESLVLTTLKRSEADRSQWVLRCYESHGVIAPLQLSGDLPLQVTDRANLLEQALQPHAAVGEQTTDQAIAPWQIATFALRSPLPKSV